MIIWTIILFFFVLTLFMVLLESCVGLLGSVGRRLFMYNRENFSFNRELYQESVFHTQKMKIKEVGLYREDLRDLCGLVVSKMDTYLIISTITLIVSLAMFYEGRLPVDVPAWIVFPWSTALTGSITFLFLSGWFSIQASLMSQLFLTRALTQWLRLPVPGFNELQKACAHLEDFEHLQSDRVLRLPVGTQARESGDGQTTADVVDCHHERKLTHFHLYFQLQRRWQGFDAFARVSLVIGTNQLVTAVIYTSLGHFLSPLGTNKQFGAISFVLLAVTFLIAHSYMSLLISKKALITFSILQSVGPLLSTFIAARTRWDTPVCRHAWICKNIEKSSVSLLSTITILFHFLCVLILFFLSLDQEKGLPTRFASVSQLDILGYLHLGKRRSKRREINVSEAVPRASSLRRKKSRLEGILSRSDDSIRVDDDDVDTLSSCSSSPEPSLSKKASDEYHIGSDNSSSPVTVSAKSLFTSLFIVILVLWITGFIYSLIVHLGYTEFGWDNSPKCKIIPSTGKETDTLDIIE